MSKHPREASTRQGSKRPNTRPWGQGFLPSERRQVGAKAEQAAARWLLDRGYKILARNVYVRGGELDLVVERGQLRAFVEVRARSPSSHGDAAATVGYTKQRRLIHAARCWLQRNPSTNFDLRFDVMAVELDDGRPTHFDYLEDAFRLSD